MRGLISEILVRDLPSDQILEVCHVIREYRFAVRAFHNADNPASEALALWRMDCCKRDCYKFFAELGLEIPPLSELV